jgi:prephenate dehydrogenase
VAEASHLPHLIAATLASTLRPEHRAVAASGFRDTTRVAAGDPGLWSAILLANAEAVLDSLDRQQSLVSEFRDALRSGDEPALRRLLSQAKASRESAIHP